MFTARIYPTISEADNPISFCKMAADEGEKQYQEQLRLIKDHEWDPTFIGAFNSVLEVVRTQIPPANMKDLEFIRKDRIAGPDPPAEEGVTWSETIIPNIAGDYQIPIRIYKPDKQDALRPAYLLYHGGGVCAGHLNTEHSRCVELTRSCGAVGISVDYRMAPENPPEVILDDCYSALKYVNDHPSQFNIDPRRIVITGASGGGLLTLAVCQMARDRRDTSPVLSISFYPMTDVGKPPEYPSRRTAYPMCTEESIDDCQHHIQAHGKGKRYIFPNQTEDLSGQCPAFFVIAQHDVLRDEGVAHAWRLMKAGVQTALHVLPGVCHGFDFLGESDSKKTAYQLQRDAFRQAVKRVKD